MVLVSIQLSMMGSYLPPVSKNTKECDSPPPPQTIISLPVHTAV